MALESRPLPAQSVQQPATSRVGVGNRVTSQTQIEVEQLDSGSPINFDASPSNLYDSQSQFNKDQEPRQQPEPNFSRLFVTNSEAFARLFEQPGEIVKTAERIQFQRKDKSSASAVNIYENNYNLITGALAVRGTSLSLVL